MRGKTGDNVSIEYGDCLSKMPAATAEQLNIAKILSKPNDDFDIRQHVAQLQELTECTEDQAVTALYDSENNLERAVELLLDRFRVGTEEEWHTAVRKPRTKHLSSNDSPGETAVPRETYDNSRRTREASHLNDGTVLQVESATVPSRAKDTRNRRTLRTSHNEEGIELKSDQPVTKSVNRANVSSTNNEQRSRQFANATDGWDPYTEYGEWCGEAIEVVNSNAAVVCGIPEEANLPDGLFVDTEASVESVPPEVLTESSEGDVPPKSPQYPDLDSVFVSKSISLRPPGAFRKFPDVPVFVVPGILPTVSSGFQFKFGGDTFGASENSNPNSRPPESSRTTPQKDIPCVPAVRTDDRSPVFSQYTSKSPVNTHDLHKSSTRNVPDDASQSENKQDLVSRFSPAHRQPDTSKVHTFSSVQKSQTPATFGSENSGQSNFLESSLKNYILDNLPSEMSKLSANEAQSAKGAQFNLQSTAPSQASINSFSHTQAGNALHQLNKASASHASSAPHHPPQSSATTTSQPQQQTTTLPPGMPHFVSQFAPPAYHMFNLPGSSNNPAPIFDLDQLQLLQQQRMLYDMHLQQQAATTAQSLLTPSTEAPSTCKSATHLTGTLGHVAANTGIRPDMLAPPIGHTPQMLPPGHPYFSYPGIVVMNSYANAFMNQQQQQQQQQSNQDGQSQNAGHSNSSLAQHQSASSHGYNNLKHVNPNMTTYEDLFDMKYGELNKQVGFKNNVQPNTYGPFPNQVVSTEGTKMTTVTGGGFNANSSAQTGGSSTSPLFPTQFYTQPYVNAAMAVVAAAQQQLQSSNGGTNVAAVNQANGTSANTSGNVPSGPQGSVPGGSNPMHMSNSASQAMVMGSSGPGLHHHHSHQRPLLPR